MMAGKTTYRAGTTVFFREGPPPGSAQLSSRQRHEGAGDDGCSSAVLGGSSTENHGKIGKMDLQRKKRDINDKFYDHDENIMFRVILFLLFVAPSTKTAGSGTRAAPITARVHRKGSTGAAPVQ